MGPLHEKEIRPHPREVALGLGGRTVNLPLVGLCRPKDEISLELRAFGGGESDKAMGDAHSIAYVRALCLLLVVVLGRLL